ncbi:LysR family transcriptional regulator [Amycolatopsis anabasis]|uniref:LysR family transcriptional regulator n=1 Tax=Amycolatopsis anabasis TaxID=1840409 RepID=UPI00131ADB0B|nr:LysR family transcriptional regulator [Amycolatopsis anabasis]
MELRQIEHFLAVVRHASFTGAAQEVHIVQSALSASVRKLETELGGPLFERTTRRVALTEAGRALLPVAHRVVADMAAARGEVSAVLGLTRGRVSIGTIQALTVVDLPREIGEFQQRHPGLRIHVRDGLVTELTEAVVNGELDLAYLAADGPVPANLTAFAQWSQRLVLVTYPGHRLAHRRRVRLAEIADEPFVDFSGSGMQAMVRRRMAQAGLRHDPVCEATHLPLLIEFVTAGLGVTIIPQAAAERAGLPFARIERVGFTRTIYLAGRQSTPLNPAARALLTHLTRTGVRTRPTREPSPAAPPPGAR